LCQIRPSTATLTGNTNKLGLMVGNAPVEDHRPVVGNFTPLANTANSFAHYINLKKHHSDKAFIKLYLRPQDRATFDVWTTNLDNGVADNRMVNLEITVQMSGPGEAYFGENKHGTSGVFLDTVAAKGTFRVVNRTFYEIFKSTNSYNYVQVASGVAGRLIGKIINNQTFEPKSAYFYHDEDDNEHYFGDFEITTTPKWPALNPADLIKMVVATLLAPYNKNGVNIGFLTDNSDRDYINLDCFAGLLGAMAVNNIADLGFNGFSMADGSPGASVSHINGVNGDLRYLRTTNDGQACLLTDAQFDFDRQNNFNDSLFAFGWGHTASMLSEHFMRGGVLVLLHHTVHFHRVTIPGQPAVDSEDVVVNQDNPQLALAGPQAGNQVVGAVVRHNNHLHVQGFDFGMVFDIL
jgi:hypothetical protein